MTRETQAPQGADCGAPATHDDPAPRWKQLTLAGNARFEQQDLPGALSSYAQARAWALQHFDRWPDPDDAVAAVVVSHLNLSEAQARLGLVDEAAQTLERAHAGLLHIAGDAQLDAALRRAGVRHLRETYAALLRFQGLHGERPELMRWLHRGCVCAAHGAPGAEPASGPLH